MYPCPGGETLLLQPHLLGSFWQSFTPDKGLELTDLVALVEPHFNQLTGDTAALLTPRGSVEGISVP